MRADANVGFLLVLICRAHRNALNDALNALGLHVGQEHVVYQLAMQDGIPQSQLARSMFIDVSTATKMLLRLERAAIIERRPDVEDARVSHVYLTSQGRELIQPVIDIWTTIEAQLMAGLNETEQALLRRFLVQLLQNLS